MTKYLLPKYITICGRQDIARDMAGHSVSYCFVLEGNANRKPLLLLRLTGLLLLRLATRQFAAWLFQLPPRNTRLERTFRTIS